MFLVAFCDFVNSMWGEIVVHREAVHSSIMGFWEDVYRSSPPWDIKHAQPAIVALVRSGNLKPGHVLDAGSGTGDNAIFLAKRGFQVIGIDIVQRAVEIAKERAAGQKADAEFRVGDALQLRSYFHRGEFDSVVDSGLFHSLMDEERPTYVEEIDWVLRDGGSYFMLCFSDKEKESSGPRKISKLEIEKTFSRLFVINYIRDTIFGDTFHHKGARGYITYATKKAP